MTPKPCFSHSFPFKSLLPHYHHRRKWEKVGQLEDKLWHWWKKKWCPYHHTSTSSDFETCSSLNWHPFEDPQLPISWGFSTSWTYGLCPLRAVESLEIYFWLLEKFGLSFRFHNGRETSEFPVIIHFLYGWTLSRNLIPLIRDGLAAHIQVGMLLYMLFANSMVLVDKYRDVWIENSKNDIRL